MSLNNNPSLLVLGAGSWGSAIALVASQNNIQVRLWDHDHKHITDIAETRRNEKYLPGINIPEEIICFSSLADACKDVQDILIVVPSKAVPEVVNKIKPYLHADVGITICSKGLDLQSGQFLHESINHILGEHIAIGVLSGPSFAMEVAKGLPTAITYATKNNVLATRIIPRLARPNFRIYRSDDIQGVQLGGFLKNIYAIAAGISDGLNLGANARSALITRALAEMFRFGHVLGAKPQTFSGLSGVGDLILTCTDNQSRNRRFGLKIGQGLTAIQAIAELGCLVEGYANVEDVYHLTQRYDLTQPIIEQVYNVIYKNKLPAHAVNELLARDLKDEILWS